MPFNRFITNSESLVTTHEQTRTGFLTIALEKNRMNDPYVKNALAFKAMVAETTSPVDFLSMSKIKPFLLTASGLSEKSMNHLTEQDKTEAIKELIDKFLKPAGKDYIDEATFRYLLIKGDAVGGKMRNRIGALGQERLIRCIFSCMDVQGVECDWMDNKSKRWDLKRDGEAGIESRVKALHWKNTGGEDRVLAFNMTILTVKKNVDICLFRSNIDEYDDGDTIQRPERAIMFGELKSGIDPAGADEHWKTGNTALERIRKSFTQKGFPNIKTSFVGAAIEKGMAGEIYEQLENGTLSNASNLTDNNQLTEYCNWIIRL